MEETLKISTEDIRIYAKALRLSNLRNNCGDIIHKAQIDKPSYLDFIMEILKAETASRQQNDLVRRMRQAKLPRNCDLDRFEYKIRSITTQSHGKKSSSFFGASPPKNAKNLIKIARARTSAASLFGALPPRRGQEGQKGARRPSVSEHMHPLL